MLDNVSNQINSLQKKHKTASFLQYKYFFVALAAIALFICMTGPQLGQPYGGFHSTNETFFSSVARNYQSHSLLDPTNHHGVTDFTLPPLLSYLVYFVFKLFGEGELQARIVVIVFSCFLIMFTYLLARELYSPQAGAIAALLVASTPMITLVGRNLQTDPVYLSLTIGSLWLFFRADRKSSPVQMLLAGILFGFALFTKQFPVLFIPALLLKTYNGLKSKRHSWKLYAAFLVGPLAIPIPYFLYQIIAHANTFFSVQQKVHFTKFKVPDMLTISRLLREIYFGFSMIWTPVFAGGAIWFALRRKQEDLCLLAVIVTLLLFNAFFYHHSYYLMGLIPLLAIAAGAMLWYFFRRKIIGGLLVLIPIGVFLCFSLLGANKYNWLYYWQVCSVIKEVDPRATILKPKGDSSSPILLYYSPHLNIRDLEAVKHDKKTGKLLLNDPHYRCFFITSATITDRKNMVVVEHFRESWIPVAFGIGLLQEPENVNFFRAKNVSLSKVGPPWQFGLHSMPEKLISATVILPPDMDVYRIRQPGNKTSYQVKDREGKKRMDFVSR